MHPGGPRETGEDGSVEKGLDKVIMKLLRLGFKREIALPMLALMFASIVNLGLVLARIAYTGNWNYSFLAWNLFLAWLPLLFALLASQEFQNRGRHTWTFRSMAAAWLLFFPNAPYIFTDLTHLTTHFYNHFWIDMVLIISCAFTGLVIGFVSLYLMQTVVRRMWGALASWVFVFGIAGLSSFGIYLGRFLRFNSWDVILRPMRLYHGIGKWAADPFSHPTGYAFPALFATFLFTSYLILYALTHLQPAELPDGIEGAKLGQA